MLLVSSFSKMTALAEHIRAFFLVCFLVFVAFFLKKCNFLDETEFQGIRLLHGTF